MYIDKYKTDDGYVDEDGCFFGTAEEFYQIGVFEFCGCGMPGENLEYVRDGLAYISRLGLKGSGYGKILSDRLQEEIQIFGNERGRNFFFYWADYQGFTEHGVGIPGWLTEMGKEVLSDLNEICGKG